MVNHFRHDMPRPIFGLGHSMGGNNLVNLSLIHPRLFQGLILVDPVIARRVSPGNVMPARASTKRRDVWPSRKAAADSFKRSKFYQAWNPKVLDLWIKHGLRNLPSTVHPSATAVSKTPPVLSADPAGSIPTPNAQTEQEVTLTTTKHQEVFSFLRSNFATASHPDPVTDSNPLTHPDVDPSIQLVDMDYYTAAPLLTFRRLPQLRPSVLYVFGSKSNLSEPLARADKMAVTGTGVDGSGGAKKGRVQEIVLDAGHLIPMEDTEGCGRQCATWIAAEMQRWKKDEEELRLLWAEVEKKGNQSTMSEEFVKGLQDAAFPDQEGPSKGKAKL